MKVRVQLDNDHLERLTRTNAISAVAELIWNSLDADAKQIDVVGQRNELLGLELLRVTDDGHGISHSEATSEFGFLGGSWKKKSIKSRGDKRILHGKDGEGRYKAFALGNHVKWISSFSENGDGVKQFTISGRRPGLTDFEVSEPEPTGSSVGTAVEVRDLSASKVSIFNDTEKVVRELAQQFALYLRQYPQVSITFDGQHIDQTRYESNYSEYDLDTIQLSDGTTHEAKLIVIEWSIPFNRAIYFCNADGFTLDKRPPGIQEPGFDFTAYVKSDLIPDLEGTGAFALEEMHPEFKQLLDAVKHTLKQHFRHRRAVLAKTLVDEWKEKKVYPYEGEPKSVIESTERQVFEVVAKNVHDYLPNFDQLDDKGKRFSFGLLRHAIESGPSSVRKIVQEVLELPDEKANDLAVLLEKTSLSAIINASTIVADRLSFLRGLEMLIYDPTSKEQLLERAQLQKILEDHTWLFGEEFSLSVADQSLNMVLEKHINALGRDGEVDYSEDVLRPGNQKGIVDLMLSRRIPQPQQDHLDHLVVELKRPSQKINGKVIDQVTSYAEAVANDERFRDLNTTWNFWVVSNDYGENARHRVRQKDRPIGLVHEPDDFNMRVWAVPWSKIIQNSRSKLQFLQEKLEYSASDEDGLRYLRSMHEKYLPQVFQEDSDQESE